MQPRTEETRKADPTRRCYPTSCSQIWTGSWIGRGLAFCRYADDCNIYVGSRVAGERVTGGIRTFLEKGLHQRVNAQKSAVARPWGRKFLGFSFTAQRKPRLRIAPRVCNG